MILISTGYDFRPGLKYEVLDHFMNQNPKKEITKTTNAIAAIMVTNVKGCMAIFNLIDFGLLYLRDL